MDEKNYLTKEEYSVWKYIKDKEIIDSELIKLIFPEISSAKKNKILHGLYKKGYIKRARKELYFNPLELTSFYKLALKITDGYIGLSSALRYYNLIEYEDFTIYIITKNFRKKILLEGTNYEIQFIPLRNLFMGFKRIDDLYISTTEKTLFDCFLKPSFVGFNNITKALYDAKIEWKKFIDIFKLADNSSLYQRTGYILELMKAYTRLNIPSFVFESLLKKVRHPVKLMQVKAKSTFNKRWKVEDNIGEKNILSWWY